MRFWWCTSRAFKETGKKGALLAMLLFIITIVYRTCIIADQHSVWHSARKVVNSSYWKQSSDLVHILNARPIIALVTLVICNDRGHTRRAQRLRVELQSASHHSNRRMFQIEASQWLAARKTKNKLIPGNHKQNTGNSKLKSKWIDRNV